MAKAKHRSKLRRERSEAGETKESGVQGNSAGETDGPNPAGRTVHARAQHIPSTLLGDKHEPLQENVISSHALGDHDDSVSSLLVETSRLQTELARLEVKFDSLNETYLQTLQAHVALENSFKATKKENELLLLQLYQLNDGASNLADDEQQPDTSAFDESHAKPAAIFEAETLVFGHVETAPPHRHMDIDLGGVRVGSQKLGPIRLRLVEHHGRAGMVVLSTADGSHPMQYWRQDGAEDGCDFLLVVPQDDQGKAYIVQARARDLILLRQAALHAAEHLADGAWTTSEHLSAFWRDVAARFVAFLDDANDRLCPGEIIIEPGPKRGSMQFRISPALVHGNILAEVNGTWAEHRLTLNLPRSGAPPLTAWPRSQDGSLVATIRWSFRQEDRRETAELAASFPRRDRNIVALLLKELVTTLSIGSPGTSAAWEPVAAALRSDLPLAMRTLASSDESPLLSEGRVRMATRSAMRWLRLK